MDQRTKTFLDIVERHKNLIYKVVHAYCKDMNAHQDLVQEIIIQLWSSFDKYNEQYRHSTWIYRISLNTAISFYRKTYKKRKPIAVLTPQLESTIQSDPAYEEDPNITLLNECLLELKEVDRAIILLYLEELSHQEIAEVIGISVTNVGTKLSRIKNIIKKKFQSKTKYIQ